MIEIYPRLLTGPVTKSSRDSRRQYLAKKFPHPSADWRKVAGSSEDAFDAVVSALVMAKRIPELETLGQASDPVDLLEGRIWY